MENKYYTPEIEEFHDGFEYEFKSGFFDGTVKTKEQFDESEWKTDTFEGHDFAYLYRALNGRNAESGLCGIRVKYLDREDIEGLGWEYDSDTSSGNISFNHPKKKIELIFFPKTRMVGFFKGRVASGFMGSMYVKNKSELKRLLKQLGI